MYFILTIIRSTSKFTRILRCRELGVWSSGFLFKSLLSKCGVIVGVVGGSTSSVDVRCLRPYSSSSLWSLSFSGVISSKSAVSPKKPNCPSLDVGCSGNGLWKEAVLMSPTSTSSSIRLSAKRSVRDGPIGVVQNFSSWGEEGRTTEGTSSGSWSAVFLWHFNRISFYNVVNPRWGWLKTNIHPFSKFFHTNLQFFDTALLLRYLRFRKGNITIIIIDHGLYLNNIRAMVWQTDTLDNNLLEIDIERIQVVTDNFEAT